MSRRLFSYYIIFFLCLWFIVPIFLNYTIPLDSAENIMWGNALSWGYYKHPPLVAWILHFAMLIFHSPKLATYLSSAIAVLLCLFYTYRLSRIFLSVIATQTAVILTTLIYYYTFPSMQFNQDIILLPLWSMLIFYTYHAINKHCLIDWCKVGILAGLSMLAKYESIVIFTAIFGFFIVNPRYYNKTNFRNIGIAVLIMLLIFSPNIYWVCKHNFLPIQYMMNSGDTSGNFIFRRLMNLQAIVITQIAAILLPLLIAWFASKRNSKNTPKWFMHFLFWVGFGPFFISILLVLIMGIQIKGFWAIPYFSMTITAMLYFTQRKIAKKSLRKILYFAIVYNVLLAGTVFSYGYFDKHNLGANYPARQIAQFTDRLWSQHYSSPLPYIISDRSNVSNVSAYSHFSPQALIDFNLQTSPWLSAKTLNEKGGVIILNGCSNTIPQSITQIVKKPISVGCFNFQPILKHKPEKKYQRRFFIIAPNK